MQTVRADTLAACCCVSIAAADSAVHVMVALLEASHRNMMTAMDAELHTPTVQQQGSALQHTVMALLHTGDTTQQHQNIAQAEETAH
jgi:hypothetical protein